MPTNKTSHRLKEVDTHTMPDQNAALSAKKRPSRRSIRPLGVALILTLCFYLIMESMLLTQNSLPMVAAEKGRDIIIANGRVILKGGKKKGNIVIATGGSGGGPMYQGDFKYKKKYMNYGGFWRKR